MTLSLLPKTIGVTSIKPIFQHGVNEPSLTKKKKTQNTPLATTLPIENLTVQESVSNVTHILAPLESMARSLVIRFESSYVKTRNMKKNNNKYDDKRQANEDNMTANGGER